MVAAGAGAEGGKREVRVKEGRPAAGGAMSGDQTYGVVTIINSTVLRT